MAAVEIPSKSIEQSVADIFKAEIEGPSQVISEKNQDTRKELAKMQFSIKPGKLIYDVALYENAILIEATDMEEYLLWGAYITEPLEAVSKNNKSLRIEIEPSKLYDILSSYADGSWKKNSLTNIKFPEGIKSEDAPIFFELEFNLSLGLSAFANVTLEPRHVPYDQRIHKKMSILKDNVKLHQMQAIQEWEEKLKSKDGEIQSLREDIENMKSGIQELLEALQKKLIEVQNMKSEMNSKIDATVAANIAVVYKKYDEAIAALRSEMVTKVDTNTQANLTVLGKRIDDGDNALKVALNQQIAALRAELKPVQPTA